MPSTGDPSSFIPPQDSGIGNQGVPLIVPDCPRHQETTEKPGAETVVASDAVKGVATNIKPNDKSWVWSVPFDRVSMQQAVERIRELVALGEPSYVITANLNYVMLHHQQPEMRRVTDEAAMILADGQPIVWRSRMTAEPLPERVAGSEMIYRLAQAASQCGWGIYFLGGEPAVAQQCADRLKSLYPGLRIAGVEAPPFRKLSPKEQREQDARIIDSQADLLLIAFGQPKGEKWIHDNYHRLGIPVSIQLGASFDFVVGTAKRAPKMWQRVGMEWAYRMMSEPRRLVPRYWANLRFLMAALISDWKACRRSTHS